MVKAEIEMLKKSLFSLKLFWEQDDECLHTGTKLKKITKKVEFNIASEAPLEPSFGIAELDFALSGTRYSRIPRLSRGRLRDR